MLKRIILLILVLFLSQNLWAADGYSILNRLKNDEISKSERSKLLNQLWSFTIDSADETFLKEMLLNYTAETKTNHAQAIHHLEKFMDRDKYYLFTKELLLNKEISNKAKGEMLADAFRSGSSGLKNDSDFIFQVLLNVKKELRESGWTEGLPASLTNCVKLIKKSSNTPDYDRLTRLALKQIHPEITNTAIGLIHDDISLKEIATSNLGYYPTSLAVDQIGDEDILRQIFSDSDNKRVKSLIIERLDDSTLATQYYTLYVKNSETGDTGCIKQINDKETLLNILKNDVVLNNKKAAAIHYYSRFGNIDFLESISDQKTLKSLLEYYENDETMQEAIKKRIGFGNKGFIAAGVLLVVFLSVLVLKFSGKTKKEQKKSDVAPGQKSAASGQKNIEPGQKPGKKGDAIDIKTVDLEALIKNNSNDKLAETVPGLSSQKINAKFKTGYTPLALAVSEGNEEAVNILLGAGADANLEDPLQWSVYDNHLKIAAMLLEHHAVATAEHIYQAAGRGYGKMVKLLHESGLSIDLPFSEDKPDTSLLLECASALEEDVDTLNYLLEQGADVNKKDSMGRTPLHWAATREHHKTIDALLKHGADPSITDDSGARPSGVIPEPELLAAINDGDLEKIKALLESGADPNEAGGDGIPPLFVIAKNHKTDPAVASLLIEHGADLDASLNHSHSPLHLAAYYCNVPVVKRLIEAGADINSYGDDGETPLFNAVKDLETTQLLLDAGADHTIAGNWGDPLKESINGKTNDIIHALLSAGATITPDHVEAVLSMTIGIDETIYRDRLKIFASYGVNYNDIDGKGKTAQAYLRQKNEPQDWTEWTCSIVSQL